MFIFLRCTILVLFLIAVIGVCIYGTIEAAKDGNIWLTVCGGFIILAIILLIVFIILKGATLC